MCDEIYFEVPLSPTDIVLNKYIDSTVCSRRRGKDCTACGRDGYILLTTILWNPLNLDGFIVESSHDSDSSNVMQNEVIFVPKDNDMSLEILLEFN